MDDRNRDSKEDGPASSNTFHSIPVFYLNNSGGFYLSHFHVHL
jgi:hypothetical protein